ncbi:MAG: DUF924 domain-containing protein [Bacteroidales bacterium]|nr:DUF924 domain-containing protein [Bacteroidales bacterium]
MSTSQEYSEVLTFWFEQTEPAQWWDKDEAFDHRVAERFGDLHRRAILGELYPWRAEAGGRLAEILVLDQFSRNIHRDKAAAFAVDGMALALAQEAVAQGLDQALPAVERSFFYLPYMHSESLLIHDIAVELFRANGIESNLHFEILHRDIIARFGRYPHRNAILGRESTQEELAFLQQPDSSF